MDGELKRSFPDQFPEAVDSTEVLRRYMLSDIEAVLHPEEASFQAQLESWEKELWDTIKPIPLHPNRPDNASRQVRIDYEMWYARLRDSGIDSPERLTCYRFFAQLDFLEKKRQPLPIADEQRE